MPITAKQARTIEMIAAGENQTQAYFKTHDCAITTAAVSASRLMAQPEAQEYYAICLQRQAASAERIYNKMLSQLEKIIESEPNRRDYAQLCRLSADINGRLRKFNVNVDIDLNTCSDEDLDAIKRQLSDLPKMGRKERMSIIDAMLEPEGSQIDHREEKSPSALLNPSADAPSPPDAPPSATAEPTQPTE